MKRIHIETLGDKTAKVYRNSEFDEYRVRLYLKGELYVPADYHTGDKADAIETAFAMVRPARPSPLSVPFNVAVLHIASKVLPCGYDVSPIAPQDFDSLVAHYEATGRVLVWNGASDKTIFAYPEVNFAFRAWHDSKHIVGGFPFDRAGELAALEMQILDIRAIYDGATADLFCDILTAEIMGQFSYKERHGGFPVDQIGFAKAWISHGQHPGSTPCPIHTFSPQFGISSEAV